jgi:hypothetical protein
MTARIPLHGFPRWTGAHATLGRPALSTDRRSLDVPVTLHLTTRARLWATWRILTRREVTSNAAARE